MRVSQGLVMTALVVGAGWSATRLVVPAVSRAWSPAPIPHTATLRVQQFGSNSTTPYIDDTVIRAVRHDGAQVVKTSRLVNLKTFSPSLEASEIRVVSDPTARSEVTIYPKLGMKTTTAMSQAAALQLNRGRRDGCATTGAQVELTPVPPGIAGYRVIKETFSELAGAEKYRMERWVAPDLDCAVLRSNTEALSADGTVLSRKVAEVISIQKGEPDAELFVLPANYKEVSPSEAIAADAAARGRTVSDGVRQAAERADARYRRQ